MKPSPTSAGLLLLLGAPLLVGAGCSFGHQQYVCSDEEKPPRPPEYDHPFIAYSNPGGRAIGEACAFDDQCITNRCSGNAGTCGECVKIRALGESCIGPHEGCSMTAVCQEGICKSRRKSEGESCKLGPKGGSDLGECDIELFCAKRPDNFESGICTRRTPLGECCAGERFRCGLGMECNRETHICEKSIPNACTNGRYCGGETVCGNDLFCHPGTLPPNASCRGVDGQRLDNACSPGFICADPKYPNGGSLHQQPRCIPPGSLGEPCIHHTCLDGLYCSQSRSNYQITTCELLPGEGQACAHDSGKSRPVCAKGFECRAGTCQAPCK